MALIVEDGSIVANADSYIDLAYARAYATARGVTLPADDAEAEALAYKAMDYLEGKRAEYQGDKTDPLNQELQWPRTGVKIDCTEVASDFIPKELKQAQARLMIEANAGVEIQPTRSGGFIVEDTTGPLTTKYSEKIGVGVEPTISAVDALLVPLFSSCGQRFALKTLRV